MNSIIIMFAFIAIFISTFGVQSGAECYPVDVCQYYEYPEGVFSSWKYQCDDDGNLIMYSFENTETCEGESETWDIYDADELEQPCGQCTNYVLVEYNLYTGTSECDGDEYFEGYLSMTTGECDGYGTIIECSANTLTMYEYDDLDCEGTSINEVEVAIDDCVVIGEETNTTSGDELESFTVIGLENCD